MPVLLLLLLCPLLTFASGSGAWQASGIGATLSHRGVAVNSLALHAPAEVSGTMTLIAWRYQLMTPEPVGLTVKLCSSSRCVVLDGPSGTTKAFSGVAASQPLTFVWQLAGRGRVYPPLRVSSNQVIVNYAPTGDAKH